MCRVFDKQAHSDEQKIYTGNTALYFIPASLTERFRCACTASGRCIRLDPTVVSHRLQLNKLLDKCRQSLEDTERPWLYDVLNK